MSEELLPKSYQKNKERLQKEAHERYQNLSKEKKKKKCYKNHLKDENKSLLSIEKNITEYLL